MHQMRADMSRSWKQSQPHTSCTAENSPCLGIGYTKEYLRILDLNLTVIVPDACIQEVWGAVYTLSGCNLTKEVYLETNIILYFHGKMPE